MVNIDIISGFLGAGKTTFANMLLRHYLARGLRPVYVGNEFGETGLDAELIASDGFGAVNIEGGCICCAMKGSVADTIAGVIERYSPTNIVFEPSGVFVFDDFRETLEQPALKARCRLENVITVVDSVNFRFALAYYGGFIHNQIRNSPVILLSKLEKKRADIEGLLCDIRNINSGALIYEKEFSLWNEGDYEAVLGKNNALPTAEHHGRHHGHDQLDSLTIKLTGQWTAEKAGKLAAAIRAGQFGDVYRAKGVLKLGDGFTLVNTAGGDVTFSTLLGVFEPGITFIGRTIKRGAIADFMAE